jgi:hypothetical protein
MKAVHNMYVQFLALIESGVEIGHSPHTHEIQCQDDLLDELLLILLDIHILVYTINHSLHYVWFDRIYRGLFPHRLHALFYILFPDVPIPSLQFDTAWHRPDLLEDGLIQYLRASFRDGP